MTAEVLRLRSELDSLRPTAIDAGRMFGVEPIVGQLLWTSGDERRSILKIATAEALKDNLVVADAVIDVGVLDGAETDGLVLDGRSLIGRVDECGIRSCSIERVTSSDFRIAAEIVRQGGDSIVAGARGVFEGDGETGGFLRHIPAELPVTIGDDVFTAPDSTWSSERLHIGTVVSAELPPGEPHWTVRVRPSGSVKSRGMVYVLKSILLDDGFADAEGHSPGNEGFAPR